MSYPVSWCKIMNDMIEINEKDHYLRTFILFTQTARIANKYQNTYMKGKSGLSVIKFIVLMAFFYNPAVPVTASHIAKWTDTDPNNVTTLINRMKREGLLESTRDKKDKRYIKIKITEKGLKTLKDSMVPAQKVIEQLMSSVTQKDALSIEKVLKVIRRNAYDGLKEF